MFLYSNIIGAMFLATEALLAYFAFSGLDNLCTEGSPKFPCKVSSLYNQNFLNLPGIG
jgi:hypothetical protein